MNAFATLQQTSDESIASLMDPTSSPIVAAAVAATVSQQQLLQEQPQPQPQLQSNAIDDKEEESCSSTDVTACQSITSGMSDGDEALDRVLSLGQIVPQERHHIHKHWHTPIIPPNAAELEIIRDLETRLASELMSDPNLTDIPADTTNSGMTTAEKVESTSTATAAPPSQLSLLIKNANLKMEKLKAEREAERERAAMESTRHRLERQAQKSAKSVEEQFEEDFLEDLTDCFWCCRRKQKKVAPTKLSVYEQQKLEMKQRKNTRKK
ncbi:hypothetical protein BDR26DRAFT_869481 [Obelidium mucronatum]|nr:hypothetical protein BDR26DRAFT_869481 [Obelidium mucronatum]